jgi:lysozyme
MQPTRISPRGLALIQQFESLRLSAYPDPKTGGAPWTIGWGHTGPEVKPGLTCTREQADAWLTAALARVALTIAGAVQVALTQNQFDALASLIYNVGPGGSQKDGIIRLRSGQPSTLLKLLNSGDYTGAAAQFLRWDSPGSSVQAGLEKRRAAEKTLFESAA